MSGFKLGLCCREPETYRRSPAEESLANAVEFFHVHREGPVALGDFSPGGGILSLARLDSSAVDLERSLAEALQSDVTHVLFLSPRTLFPFYALERLIQMPVPALSGISWTWKVGSSGESPEIFPRLGYFDPEGRPYPFFGWTAPQLFEVDWCGLDCLLLARRTLEAVEGSLDRYRDEDPALRISRCLRSLGFPILIDSSVQCPRVLPRLNLGSGILPRFIPSRETWREFSDDSPVRRLPEGHVYDPAYRGRDWYLEWVESVVNVRCEM